jgi:hypothetical protein
VKGQLLDHLHLPSYSVLFAASAEDWGHLHRVWQISWVDIADVFKGADAGGDSFCFLVCAWEKFYEE